MEGFLIFITKLNYCFSIFICGNTCRVHKPSLIGVYWFGFNVHQIPAFYDYTRLSILACIINTVNMSFL